jgi:hypothetical protein
MLQRCHAELRTASGLTYVQSVKSNCFFFKPKKLSSSVSYKETVSVSVQQQRK